MAGGRGAGRGNLGQGLGRAGGALAGGAQVGGSRGGGVSRGVREEEREVCHPEGSPGALAVCTAWAYPLGQCAVFVVVVLVFI